MVYPPNTDEKIIDSITVLPDGCWELTEVGSDREGYRVVHQNERDHYAHRIVSRILGVEVDGVVHHTCENRRCVNISHHEHMTQSDHVKRHRTWELAHG